MKRSMISHTAALLTIFALGACAHGGQSPLPVAGDAVGSPHAAPSNARTHATVTIKIPRRDVAAAVRRYYGKGRSYISAATQSIGIVATNTTTNAVTTVNAALTIDNSATGANRAECVSSTLSTICTVMLALDPGTYSLAFTTYDGPLDNGGAPTGNQLSLASDVPFTVTAGAANNLNVSLAAVPAGISVLAAPTEKLVRGDQITGFSLMVSNYTHAFDTYAYDADGDIIIGPGAPTFNLAQSTANDDAQYVTVTEPTTSQPNRFTVTFTKPLGIAFPISNANVPPLQIEVDALPTDQGVACTFATCSRNVQLRSLDLYFAGGPTEDGMFVAGDKTPFATTQGLTATKSIADKNGNVFFTDGYFVAEWKPPYDGSVRGLFRLTQQQGPILNIAVDDSNDGIVVGTSDMVYRYDAPYSTLEQNFGGFDFSSAPNNSQILFNGRGQIIIADDVEIFITSAGLVGNNPSSIAIKGASIALDPGTGDLLTSVKDGMGNGIVSAYEYNNSNAHYDTVRASNTNGPGFEYPLRVGGGTLYAPATGTNDIFAYSLPLTSNAPATLALLKANAFTEFELTASGNGFAAIAEPDPVIDEQYDFLQGVDTRIEASGTGNVTTISVVH